MCLGINYSKLINKFSITFQQLIPPVHFRHLERNLNKKHSQTNVSESLTSGKFFHTPSWFIAQREYATVEKSYKVEIELVANDLQGGQARGCRDQR